jgi:hypothetical protein
MVPSATVAPFFFYFGEPLNLAADQPKLVVAGNNFKRRKRGTGPSSFVFFFLFQLLETFNAYLHHFWPAMHRTFLKESGWANLSSADQLYCFRLLRCCLKRIK